MTLSDITQEQWHLIRLALRHSAVHLREMAASSLTNGAEAKSMLLRASNMVVLEDDIRCADKGHTLSPWGKSMQQYKWEKIAADAFDNSPEKKDRCNPPWFSPII